MKPLLIVDGYNVIGAWSEAEKKGWSLDESRDRLMRQLEDYAGFSGEEILLVFDGYQSERTTTTEEKHGDLTLIFTRHGETADSYIERAAAQTPRYRDATFSARVVIYPEPLPLFFLLELSNHFLRPLHRLFPHQGKCRFLHSDGRFHRLHRHSGGIGSERMFQPGFELAGILQYDGRDSRNRLHLCVHLSNDLSDTKIQKRETG